MCQNVKNWWIWIKGVWVYYSYNFSLSLKLFQNKTFKNKTGKWKKKSALYSLMPTLALLNFSTTKPFSQEPLPKANLAQPYTAALVRGSYILLINPGILWMSVFAIKWPLTIYSSIYQMERAACYSQIPILSCKAMVSRLYISPLLWELLMSCSSLGPKWLTEDAH